jgi:RNA polymerase sigma factor (sigma-70 family)
MSDRGLPSSILAVLRRLKVKEVKQLPDAELLERYIATRDEAAFTVLVGRHGPTVLSVCRRVLRDHDVDDVFQATFLALAKDAGTIRRREAVGAWLYEVAYRAALRAKARSARSLRVEQAASTEEGAVPADAALYRDVQQVLDEELHRLPERLRKPLVLVHLVGHVQAEAARELGITDRALRKRLRIGRDRLRVSLTRRGVTLTAAGVAAVLDQSAAAGPLTPGLLRPTVESVLAYMAGQAAAVSASTVSLATAGAGGWLAGRVKLIGVLAVPVLATLVFTASALTPAGSRVAAPPNRAASIAPIDELPPGRITVLTGRILGADGQPVPHATVTALVRRPWQSADRGLHDEVVARGAADADGRYRLAVPVDFPSSSPDRRVTLLAHAPGHAPVTGDVRINGRPATTDLQMPGTAAATGRLVAPDGKPAAEVRLALVRLGKAVWEAPQGAGSAAPAGWPADVVTDARGAFRLDGLPAGENLWLQVRDDRYALTTFRVNAGVTDAEAVKLSEPRLLTGRITAADTGRPLANARVAVDVGAERQMLDYYTVLSAAPELAATASPAEVSGVTDADGRYRMRLPPGVDYHVYVYPPDGSTYIGWRWKLGWEEGEAIRERTTSLRPGVEIKGQVVEESGKPIDGACICWMRDEPVKAPAVPTTPSSQSLQASWNEALTFSDSATLSGTDGRFRIVVPNSPVILRVFGPTADYLLCDYEYQRCPQCGKDHLRLGENARVRVDPSVRASEPIRATLRRGLTVTGRAIGPDGEPIRDGVLVCRTICQPLRKPAPRLVPIRDGVYQLPGCDRGRVYPVLLFDAVRGLAAVAEFQIPAVQAPGASPGNPSIGRGPTIRLTPCGSASVRLVDATGRPLAGRRPQVEFWLADDRPASLDVKGNGPWSNAMDASWVDPRHYLPGPITDADGVLTVPTLIPGLQYHILFNDAGPKGVYAAPFRVAPGQSLRLPDLVARPDGDDEEHARPPSDARSNPADDPEK